MLTRAATQKLVTSVVVLAVALALGLFIYRTYRAYLSGPSITISEPANYAAFSTSTVTIAGTAARVQDIALNGRQISIDDKGEFSETVLLFPGYNIETLAAHDRFGHAVEQRLELVYHAPKAMSASTTAATSTTL